jgi:hypothetical protein
MPDTTMEVLLTSIPTLPDRECQGPQRPFQQVDTRLDCRAFGLLMQGRLSSDKLHLLRHAIDPMAALARTTHQHSIAYALVMQMLRYVAGFIALHDEIEEAPRTK